MTYWLCSFDFGATGQGNPLWGSGHGSTGIQASYHPVGRQSLPRASVPGSLSILHLDFDAVNWNMGGAVMDGQGVHVHGTGTGCC